MRNTQESSQKNNTPPVTDPTSSPQPPPPKIYTQEDIDVIDEQYKNIEKKYASIVQPPEDHYLNQYRKTLVKETHFVKETIIYDSASGKWVLLSEKPKS